MRSAYLAGSFLIPTFFTLAAQAGPFTVDGFAGEQSINPFNLGFDTFCIAPCVGGFGPPPLVNTIGANGASVLSGTLKYGKDSFGRKNEGAYTSIIASSANDQGFSGFHYSYGTVVGEASPQLFQHTNLLGHFTTTSAATARMSINFTGSNNASLANGVGFELKELNASGDVVGVIGNNGPHMDNNASGGSGTVDVALKAGTTYQILARTQSRVHVGQTLSSQLNYSILVAQSLDGNSEENSLKPANDPSIRPDNAAEFVLSTDDLLGAAIGATVWLDPEVATGFEYAIDGAEVASVTAPMFSTVADADGYELLWDGMSIHLSAGETFSFTSPVDSFILTGIDPTLGLLPEAAAFTLGLDFVNFTGGAGSTVLVTQTPIVENVSNGSVPLPAPLLLMLTGALVTLRRGVARGSTRD